MPAINLASLGSKGFIIQGDEAGDSAGYSLSAAGDVNGDGFDDLIIGAPLGDDGGSDAGEAYVIFGKTGGFGPVDLSSLGTAGFVIQGDQAGDRAGFSVDSAGDVNGDGFGDLIVGAPHGDDGGASAGEAYVIFGQAEGFGTIDLTGLAPADGFIIQGFQQSGWSVSAAGDVDGDGFDDIAVGAPGSILDRGAAFVVYGKAEGFDTIDLAEPVPVEDPRSAGFSPISGGEQDARAGFSVSAAGDVNGDGLDDLIVGAPDANFAASDGADAYLLFGKEGGLGIVALDSLAPADGFVIDGASFFDETGWSVSSAGDINGDGIDDLIVGSPASSGGNGKACVIFGRDEGFGNINLATLAPADGFIIEGATDDRAGFSVSGAGDFNGDSFDDYIVGVPGDDVGDAGKAYLIFGRAEGFATIDLASLPATSGFVIQGGAAGDRAGWSVSGAGDVNGDGFDDLFVGAPGNDAGGIDAGAGFVIFGAEPGRQIIGSSSDDNLEGGSGDDDIEGRAGSDVLAGGAGDDTLDGGIGADTMNGGLGNDAFFVDNALDQLIEAAGGGADRVASSVTFTLGANVESLILAGTGAINGNGNTLANLLVGNGAANVLNGGSGADTMQGGLGNDSYVVDSANDKVIETSASGGTDKVTSSVSFALGTNVENLILSGTGAVNGTGNGLANRLTGNDGSNTLNGSGGADTMSGGLGNDRYVVDNVGDVAIETNAAGGNDAVTSTITFTLGANIENLVLVGTAALGGTGNSLANLLVGNAGANLLDGKAGADTMQGGLGHDIYVVDNALDKAVETSPGGGTDLVRSSVSFTLGSNVENLTLLGSGVIDGTGNNGANQLTGNSAANILKGLNGNDVIDGGAGNDQIHGGAGNDSLKGGTGADAFLFNTLLSARPTSTTSSTSSTPSTRSGSRMRCSPPSPPARWRQCVPARHGRARCRRPHPLRCRHRCALLRQGRHRRRRRGPVRDARQHAGDPQRHRLPGDLSGASRIGHSASAGSGPC